MKLYQQYESAALSRSMDNEYNQQDQTYQPKCGNNHHHTNEMLEIFQKNWITLGIEETLKIKNYPPRISLKGQADGMQNL